LVGDREEVDLGGDSTGESANLGLDLVGNRSVDAVPTQHEAKPLMVHREPCDVFEELVNGQPQLLPVFLWFTYVVAPDSRP
jgi:hypothetical protein